MPRPRENLLRKFFFHKGSHDKMVACLLSCWSGDAFHLELLSALSVLLRVVDFLPSLYSSQRKSGGLAPLLIDGKSLGLVRVDYIISARCLLVQLHQSELS